MPRSQEAVLLHDVRPMPDRKAADDWAKRFERVERLLSSLHNDADEPSDENEKQPTLSFRARVARSRR
jgi:hypothetical protein